MSEQFSRRSFLARAGAALGISKIAGGDVLSSPEEKRQKLESLFGEIVEILSKQHLFAYDEIKVSDIFADKLVSIRLRNVRLNDSATEELKGIETRREDLGELAGQLASKFDLKEGVTFDLCVDADLEQGIGPYFSITVNGADKYLFREDGSGWGTEEAIMDGIKSILRDLEQIKREATD